MIDPLVATDPHVELGTEGTLVCIAFGALIDQRTLQPRKWKRLHIAFYEVLADLRPHVLEQEAQMSDQRIVAQDGVARLQAVAQPDQEQQQRERRHHLRAHAATRPPPGGARQGGQAHQHPAQQTYGQEGWKQRRPI